MRLAIITVLFLVLPAVGSAAVIYVPDDYPAIQDAIEAALDGDTIIVRPGTYMETVDFVGKAVRLQSEQGPEVTTIDGSRLGAVVRFSEGEGSDSVLDGFTVTNGGSKGIDCHDGSPTIINNIVTNNEGRGIGFFCLSASSSPLIAGNIVTGNEGGISCTMRVPSSFPRIRGNTVIGNHSSYGGGIRCHEGSPVIIDNVVTGNTADYGGGLWCAGATGAVISNNYFGGNSATAKGGGIRTNDCESALVIGNIVTGNDAAIGGGIMNSPSSTVSLVNNIISSNSAGTGGGVAVADHSVVTIINSTICGNTASDGGGIYCTDDSAVTAVNTILWNNSAYLGPEIWIGSLIEPSSVNVSYSDVRGWQAQVYIEGSCSLSWGAGMINAYPQFVDPAVEDFHLKYDSPCRNGGCKYSLLPLLDFEGDPRVAGGIVDMGADEFFYHLYQTGEVIPGGTIDIKVVGPPGVAPVRLLAGSGTREPPLTTPYGDLYLAFPFRAFDLGAIPSDGVLVAARQVPVWWLAGEEHPLQTLIGPMAPGTKLSNLLLLEVDQ